MADDPNDAAGTGTGTDDARGLRRMIEEANAATAAAKAELAAFKAQTERSAAFAKAGVPDTPLGQLLRKTYEGALDPDAIKAYAVEHGLPVAAPPTTTPPAERDQLLQLQSDPPAHALGDKTAMQQLEDRILATPPGDEGNQQIQDLLIQVGMYPLG